MKTEDLARLIIHTAETHEAMFNNELWRCQQEEYERTATPIYGIIHMNDDPKRFYHLSLEESALHSCKFLGLDPRLARFIDLSLEWWNDTIAWAEDILNFQNSNKKGE